MLNLLRGLALSVVLAIAMTSFGTLSAQAAECKARLNPLANAVQSAAGLMAMSPKPTCVFPPIAAHWAFIRRKLHPLNQNRLSPKNLRLKKQRRKRSLLKRHHLIKQQLKKGRMQRTKLTPKSARTPKRRLTPRKKQMLRKNLKPRRRPMVKRKKTLRKNPNQKRRTPKRSLLKRRKRIRANLDSGRSSLGFFLSAALVYRHLHAG